MIADLAPMPHLLIAGTTGSGRARQRAERRAWLGVAAAALVVLALNAGERGLRRQRLDEAQRRLAETAEAIAGEPVPHGQESLLVERALPRRDEETRPFRDALDPDGLEGRLAQVLAEATTLGVEMTKLGLSPVAISIQGSAPSIQVVEAFAERLRGQGWSVQSETPGTAPDGRPQFILKGMAGHEG